jgi:D-alanyl-D-alanine endopeptidase (penicillin-binding protein 7)
MRDVLSVMLVASSNEAAESLAAHVGREKFLAEMNAQAASWGLVHTQYTDPTGLSASNRSTAREIFTIAQHVYLDTPNVFATTRKGSVTVHALETGVPYTAYATHQLVRDPGFLGGKTGYTDEAKGNLLSLFQIGSQVDALIVLGSGDRFGDTRRLKATLTPLP